MPIIQTRRQFISSVALAGAAGLLHVPRVAAAEGALETTTVRVVKVPGAICVAPQNLSEELLRAEGFQTMSAMSMGGRPANTRLRSERGRRTSR